MWWIIWAVLALLILIFNYSASKNNESYDLYILQKRYFDEYVNNKSLVFVKYVGDDRCEIKHNHHTLTTISTTDDEKIRVEFEDTYFLYDDFKHFYRDWRFDD